ncbi:MAG: hypothetical protein IJ072_02250, partial [Oscillospiraceae bacterium]|nr:hypothetical protein [Oscillospiraceae bacterium]
MKISMRLAEELLGLPAAGRKKSKKWDEFCLKDWSLKCVSSDILTVTSADKLKELSIKQDNFVICAGEPCENPPNGEFLFVHSELSALIDAVNGMFSRLNNLETELLRAAYAQRSIGRIISLMGPLMQGCLAVFSMDLQPVSIYEQDITESTEDKGRRMSEELAYSAMNDPQFSANRYSTAPFLLEKGIFGMDCLCLNVFNQGVPVCLIVHYEPQEKFAGFEYKLLEIMGEYLQIVYGTSIGDARRLPNDRMRQVAKELLRGQMPRRESVEYALMYRGWPVTGPFMCGIILPSQGDVFNSTPSYYCRSIGKAIPNTYTLEDKGEIVCIVYLKPYGG